MCHLYNTKQGVDGYVVASLSEKGRKKGNKIVTVKPYERYYSQQIEFQITTRNRTCGNHLFGHSQNKNDILKH